MSYLQDNFNDNTKASWWDVFTPGSSGCSVEEVNQRLECTCNPSTGECNGGYVTVSKYDLSEHYVEIDVERLDNTLLASIAVATAVKDMLMGYHQMYQIFKNRRNSQVCVRRNLNGSLTTLHCQAWAASTGKLRIELRADGRIYFYENEVVIYSENYQLPSTEIYIFIFCAGSGDLGYVGTDYLDNFISNIPIGAMGGDPTAPTGEETKSPEVTAGNLKTVKCPECVCIEPGSDIGSGQETVAVAGTCVQLSEESLSILSVTVKALATNGGNIYVGDETVDATSGFVLAAGESVSMDVDDLSDVYIDADVNGEGVSFIYLLP